MERDEFELDAIRNAFSSLLFRSFFLEKEIEDDEAGPGQAKQEYEHRQ